jgi:hypothetical protein
MRHFSCDLCGRTLTPGDEPRYLVRVEGFALSDDTELDETDADSVDAMEEMLTEQVAFEALDPEEAAEAGPGNARREYDLCRACYARLLNDPLGLETRHAPRFSRN